MPKSLLLSAVSLLGQVAFAIILASCAGGDQGEIQSTTQPPTSTTLPDSATPEVTSPPPHPNDCPVAAEACSFAEAARDGIIAGQVGSLTDNAVLQEFICPESRPQGLGGPYPLCDGAAAAERRSGFRVAFLASEGQVLDRNGLQQTIERWLASAIPQASDEYGDGSSRLYTIGCPGDDASCTARSVLVFSQLFSPTPGSPRTQLMLFFDRFETDGDPRLTFVALGPLLQPGEEEAALVGGSFPRFIVPEDWSQAMTFFPLD